MTNVDPFVIKWPTAWENDPEIGPAVNYLNRFLHDLWQRTGGGVDVVSDVIGSESYETSTSNGQYISLHEEQENLDGEVYIPPELAVYDDGIYIRPANNVCDHEPILEAQFNARSVMVDTDAVNKDFIEATRGATIRADKYPGANDTITVANGDGSTIRFDGNGNNILYTDIGACVDIQRKGTSITFKWFDEGPYWRPV